MKWSCRAHGDWLEKEAANFISQNISPYEETWGLYIGHQGNGVMANMTHNLTNEQEKFRREFSQHHYTILESLYLMQRACDHEQVHEVKTFEDYRAAVNNIMLFQAYAGRLRDNFSKCFEMFYNADKAGECDKKLEAFYTGRHIFIHGKKVPFTKDELGLMKVPRLKKSKQDPQGFGADMLWEDAVLVEFQYTGDYMKESMAELCCMANGLLQQLLDAVKKLVNDNGWELEPPTKFNFNNSTAASGSTATIQIVLNNPNSNFSSSGFNENAVSGVVHHHGISGYNPNYASQKPKKNRNSRRGK